MSVMERIVEAATRLLRAEDEDEFLHALSELRDEVAAEPTETAYTNELIGGHVE